MKHPVFRRRTEDADNGSMDGCPHGMDDAWCYLCLVDARADDPRTAWGLADWQEEDLALWQEATGPMPVGQAAYLRFLCEEFDVDYDGTLKEGEAALVIDSFLSEPASQNQRKTLEALSKRAGETPETDLKDLTYGAARSKIRRLFALQGLGAAG
jgi:hypothetical protein